MSHHQSSEVSLFSPVSLCQLALLTAFIAVTGAIKIPNIIPGVDFQLSAPLAVAICAVFGFKRYIVAGCLSSVISLLLGTQTLLHVAIALQFRLWVGLFLYAGRRHWLSIILAGPIASALARLSLYPLFGDLVFAMVTAAIPGYLFTACAAPFVTTLLRRILQAATSYGPHRAMLG